MARYQVILAYDGAGFSGMQRQAEERSVQGVVEEALRVIGWGGESILFAGRTDAGVHAHGQVIAFDFDWRHTSDDLINALNANLPADVAAQRVEIARDDFHPRYDAVSRRYRYEIFCQPHRDPLRERFAWRVWPGLSLGLLQTAGAHLPGAHDFAAFGSPTKPGGPTVREVFSTSWRQRGDAFTFEIVANAFLYHMVRRLVSLQVEIGQGKLEPEVVVQYLESRQTESVQGLAPPQGLVLEEVCYA